MIEDFVDDDRIFDAGNHFHGATAGTAGLDVDTEVTDYIIGYYSKLRPHSHNGMLPPNEAEKMYYQNY